MLLGRGAVEFGRRRVDRLDEIDGHQAKTKMPWTALLSDASTHATNVGARRANQKVVRGSVGDDPGLAFPPCALGRRFDLCRLPFAHFALPLPVSPMLRLGASMRLARFAGGAAGRCFGAGRSERISSSEAVSVRSSNFSGSDSRDIPSNFDGWLGAQARGWDSQLTPAGSPRLRSHATKSSWTKQ